MCARASAVDTNYIFPIMASVCKRPYFIHTNQQGDYNDEKTVENITTTMQIC